MFYFRIQATPKPDSNHAKDGVGGAEVSVWINFPHDEGAEVLARYYIEDGGWISGRIMETIPTSLDDYPPDHHSRKFVEEAIENGGSFVFHRWPSDAEDADVDYEMN